MKDRNFFYFPTRIKLMVFLLKNKDKNISDISKELKITFNGTSQSLKIMKENGLVDFRMKGGKSKKYYFLTEKGKRIAELLTKIEGMIK